MAKIDNGFQIGLSWVPVIGSVVPPGAIEVDDGIYVARGEYNNEKIPGKYVSKYNTCYVPFGGEERQLSNCEVLCDTSINRDGSCYKWVSDSNGDVPKNAIVAGLADDGAPLFVTKAPIEKEMCVGKIHSGHSCAYIPYGGNEHSVEEYKVLVLKK